MARNRGPVWRHQGGPKPVGWREVVNPKMSRRGFLAGASAAPLLAEPALAQIAASSAPSEMALEFDLSGGGTTLDIRQFVKPASPGKGQLQPAWSWRTFAQSYGPVAWFEVRVADDDDFDRRVVVRDAKFGGVEELRFALRFRAEVFTEPAPPVAPGAKKPHARKPRRYATEWSLTLETDLWAPPGHPNALWSSKPRPFREFADGSKDLAPLSGEIDPAAASNQLYAMFDERVSSDESRRTTLTTSFHVDGRWSLERTPQGVAASCFDGRARARRFTFGWYRDGGCAPYFTGFAASDDEAKVDSTLRLGREGELNVLVRSEGAKVSWEVRRALSPLVGADGAADLTFQTFSKIDLDAATLDVVEGKATFAAGVPAKTLAVSECDLPINGAPLRHVLWGDVRLKSAETDFAEIETIAGRLRVDAPEPPAPVMTAADAARAESCLASPGPQRPTAKDPAQAEAAISAGDRSGAPDASLWAVFDRPQGARDYTTRRIAFDFALRGSDLALPDASRSRLVFERGLRGKPPPPHPPEPPPEYADLRLLFEDGKPLGFLPRGEFPRREASSFVWLGGLASGAIQARFDLTRATLSAARDVDLLNLRFRFVDFALTLEAGRPPTFAPRRADCRVIETAPGEYRDDRPTLVVEFDPQHVLEEALFAQNLELPDVALPELSRSDILNHIASLNGDRAKILDYKRIVLDQKKARPGAAAFTQFAADFEADRDVRNLKDAADQQIYIGPFALEPDAMALARSVARRTTRAGVAAAIKAMFDRISAYVAADHPRSPPTLEPPDFVAAALRNEAVLESQEPLYAVFREFYRERMIARFTPYGGGTCDPLKPHTLGADDVEFFFAQIGYPRPPWPGAAAPLSPGHPYCPVDPRDARRDDALGRPEVASSDTFLEFVAQSDQPAFDGLVQARLSGRSRLAFRVDCAPPVQANAVEAGLPGFSGASPGRPGAGGFTYAPMPFKLEALTDWSRHELAVTRRAQKLYEAAKDGIVPPIGYRAPNLSDPDVLAFQGVSRGAVNGEQRMGEIRAALAQGPKPNETAIELPARLTLSPAQDAIFLTQRRLPRAVVEEKPGPALSAAEMAGAAELAKRWPERATLWIARLALDGPDPNLRVVGSPDLRPNALLWLAPGMPRQSVQGAPPRGRLAPWFIGPEQMDGLTLDPAQVNASLPPNARVPASDDDGVCAADQPGAQGLLDHFWLMLRRLCERRAARAGLGEAMFFRTVLDAYDRHELVLLSSAYGLPVVGKRHDAGGKPGSLVENSGQIEPGEDFAVLDADKGQAIQRPQPLRVQELWLSALGGALMHDTHFFPSAGANNLWGGKLFDGFSIERWREEIVLGRDIVGEVVYKGYLFPFGHRASLVKLTERLFLKARPNGAGGPAGPVKAVLVQRIFLRVGRKTMNYPAVGQALYGRLWCAKDVTLVTLQTPDLQDPFGNGPQNENPNDPENPIGGRIFLDGEPGLAFWPRVNETDEGLVKFALTIDGAATETPLIFVDNVAATRQASLNALAHAFRRAAAWKTKRRTLLLGDQNIRFAEETKTGDCSFKAGSLVVSVTGREGSKPGGWTGDVDNFETTPILEGAEQPPFYPCLETGSIRLEQVERFSGRKAGYFDVQYDGRYARFGFTKPDPGKASNPLEIFLNLRACAGMAMAANGDRSGGVGRPETLIVALSRAKGPVGASVGLAYQQTAPADPEQRGDDVLQPMLQLKDGTKLIDSPALSSALPPLLSLADYFDPRYRPVASAALTRAASPRGDASEALEKIRAVMADYFSDDAKLLGVVTFKTLLTILGFDSANLLDAAPALKQTLQFGVDAAQEAGDALIADLHAHVLAPLLDTVHSFQSQWRAASDRVQAPQAGGLTLNQLFPEIGGGLDDLARKLKKAQADSDVLGLALDLSDVYESAHNFASALERLAVNPTARLRQAAVGQVQAALAQLSAYAASFADAVAEIKAAAALFMSPDHVKAWLQANMANSGDVDGKALGDALSILLGAPELAQTAQQVGQDVSALASALSDFDQRLAFANPVLTKRGDLLVTLATTALDHGDVQKALVGAASGLVGDATNALTQAIANLSSGAAATLAPSLFVLQRRAGEIGRMFDPSAPDLRAVRQLTDAAEAAAKFVALAKELADAASAQPLAPADVLNKAGALADALFGPSGQAALDAAAKLSDGLKGVVNSASAVLAVIAKPLPAMQRAAYAAALTACVNSLGGKTQPGAPATAPLSPPLQSGDDLIDAVGAAVTALQDAVGAVRTAKQAAAANVVTIDQAVAAKFPNYAEAFQSFAQALLDGFVGPGAVGAAFVDDLSQFYREAAAGLAELRAIGEEIGGLPADEVLADRLFRYLRAVSVQIDLLAIQMQALCDKADALVAQAQTFASGDALAAACAYAIDTTANPPAPLNFPGAAAIFAVGAKLSAAEAAATRALTILVNRGVALAQQAGLFTGPALAQARAVLDLPEVQVAAALSPAMTDALHTAKADFSELNDRLAVALALKPVTDNPTTLSALLAEKLGGASANLTVRDYFKSPNPLFAPLARAIMTANAKAAADWRRLQLSVAGLPQFWKGQLIAALEAPRKTLAAVYTDNQIGLIALRNKLADAIDSDLLSLAARRAVFVNPVYAPAAQRFDILTPSLTLDTLKQKDRLAEEGAVLTNFAAYQPPASGAPDLTFAAFLSLVRSWGADPIGPAAPLQIERHIANLASEVLRGEILSLIDVSAFRDALLDAVTKLVPTKASFSYDFSASVDDDTGEDSIFQAAPGGLFTLATRIEVDLLNSSSTSLISTGALGPFSINLVGDTVKALKLRFSGAKFESRNGGAPRFDIAYDNFEVGEDLEFVKQLEAYLTPSDGSGFHIGPSPFGPGLEVGYGVNLGGFGIGPVSFFNIVFDVSAELPFDNRPAMFKTSLGRRTAPFTISALPYAGSGFFSVYASAHGIVGFEAGFMFGGGGSIVFGPLQAQVQVQVGAYIRVLKLTDNDGKTVNSTEIAGTFLAAGSASIWIFHFGACLYVSLAQEQGGTMHGEAIFTFSFSCCLVDYHYSVTGHHSQASVGHNNQSSGQNDGPAATRFAAFAPPGRMSDAFDDLVEIAANPKPYKPAAKATAPQASADASAAAPPPDVASTAQCQSQNWKAYSSYFDFSQIAEEA